MFRWVFILFVVVLLGGCGGTRKFTNLGNGVGVPAGSIEDYATAHGISREEARARMRDEIHK